MFRNLSLYSYCLVVYAAFIIQKENIVICFVINSTLEIQWEKTISWKTAYKVAWLSLTYYLKLKAMPLSFKKRYRKFPSMFFLYSLYAQVRICGRYFYILLVYFLCALFSGFENVLIFIQYHDRLSISWSRRGTITGFFEWNSVYPLLTCQMHHILEILCLFLKSRLAFLHLLLLAVECLEFSISRTKLGFWNSAINCTLFLLIFISWT